MELVTPNVGTLFWMLLFFSIILLILKKLAWKPILNSLKNREKSIEDALQSVERAKEEMARLKADNEKIL
ncbi:MAG: F0F1 ATP synthase subunit B, partial [Bacteroidales bacterium]